MASWSLIAASAVTGVGLFYIWNKLTLVREGEVRGEARARLSLLWHWFGGDAVRRHNKLSFFISLCGRALSDARTVSSPTPLLPQVALVRHIDGRMRVLGRGWHLLETIGTSVRLAALALDYMCVQPAAR
jgi:hypothetical protein